MSVLEFVSSLLFTDVKTTLITLLIGYMVYALASFYAKVLSLPAGPFPLPVLGSMLALRGTKEHWSREMEKIGAKYGPVFTFWLGNKPIVFIDDIDIARDAFKKNEFAGRPKDLFFPDSDKIFTSDDRKDITFSSGHPWEALRRVAHSAVLKYSVTDKLANLVSETVDHTVDIMLKTEGLNKRFSPLTYVHNTFLNILATSTFSKRYDLNDQEYKLLKYVTKDLFTDNSQRIFFWQMSWIFRRLDQNKFNEMKKSNKDLVDLLETKFKSHYKDYDESVIRDFCDALISAKDEAIRQNKESAPYLKDGNIAMAIINVFFAGAVTSQMTFNWFLLHMLYNREIEKNLRREVESEIGDRIPTHEDRNRCHYVMAFISETLRHSNVVPSGLNHMARVNTKLNDHNIPEGTDIMVFQGHILHQSEHWDKPYDFIPERFLDSNGQYLSTRPKAFIPFGVGRRVCLGEKLAIANFFLVLVRFLQKTTDLKIELHCDPKEDMLSPDPNNAFDFHPKNFEISFKNK